MEQYPDHETYRALYRRYNPYNDGRDVHKLLQLVAPLDGARVLDLCAGDGCLAVETLVLGARTAVMVEAAESMVPVGIKLNSQLDVRIGDVRAELAAMKSRGELFDRIVCRQAINYWLDAKSARRVAAVLAPTGIFAFNTFHRKPAEKPRIREYTIGDSHFVEVSWLIGTTVHHVQVRDGIAPHYTTFQWLSPERFREILEPHFRVESLVAGTSRTYKCTKKA